MIVTEETQNISEFGTSSPTKYNVGQVAAIVDMLADKVYTNKPLAVVRELSCNAHDSHVVAGTTHIPFSVHIPTTLEPWFAIRDYGTGLSDADVRTIFAGIGVSTKRDSNKVIGCFGVGNLSPFSISDSFTVTSFFNGKKMVYACRRDGSRNPEVVLLSESDSNEPNGLSISVPTGNHSYSFFEAAVKTFQFWEGTIAEFNNPEVMTLIEDANKAYLLKSEYGNFGISRFNSSRGFYAVMGNIAYKVPYSIAPSFSGYAKCELGTLEFDVARENLVISDKNKAALEAVEANIRSQVTDLIDNQIMSEPTPFLRAVKESTLLRSLSIDTGMWAKKYQLPKCTHYVEKYSLSSKGKMQKDIDSVHVPIYSEGKVIEYYLYQPKMAARIRLRLKTEPKLLIVVLTHEQMRESLIDANLVKNLSDLPKPTRARSGSGNKTGGMVYRWSSESKRSECWTPALESIEESLESGDELIYIDLNRHDPVNSVAMPTFESLNSFSYCPYLHGVKIYGINSLYKKSEDFAEGNWIHIDDYLKRELSVILADGVYDFSQQKYNLICELSDIGIAETCTIVQLRAKAKILSENRVCSIANRLGLQYNLSTEVEDAMDEFLNKYPMLKLLLARWFTVSSISGKDRGILVNYLGGAST